MSDNPFDVFAADLQAAVPKKEEPAAVPEPINIMASPSPAPVPVMNQPIMKAPEPAPAMNGMGGMAAAPPAMNAGYGMGAMGMGMGGPPAPMGGAMGMAPPQYGAPAPAMGMGMGMGGMPAPTPAPPAMNGGYPPMGMGVAPGAPNAMVPSQNPSNPYAMPTAYGQPPAAPAPFMGMPPTQPPAPAAPAPSTSAPFGAPAAPEPTPGPPPAAPVDATSDPWAQPVAAPAPVPPQNGGIYGNPSPPVPHAPEPAAIVPVPNGMMHDDPFGVFQSTPAPPPETESYPSDVLSVATPANPNQLTQDQVQAAADGDDPWAEMGFGPPAAAPSPSNGSGAAGGTLLGNDAIVPAGGDNGAPHKEGDLPAGGEWYDARIFTPTLGVMFFKPQELTDSLFLQTDRSLVEALDDRPVVAFIVEGSSARAAGVELGHVLLKVNGIDVKNPKEASRLIKEGPRPLPLLFYVPDTTVVVAEGEHMVKYDTRETGAPNSAKDWKPKYVVIGGIIAQPWMMNMYRSKSEYDIAVIETQARRPVSVKVKQFSLQGARIQNDWQGPQMVKYKNKLHPWKYIVVLPVSRNPIKISSPNLSQLKPVHEGIRRVLMAQQRHQSPSRPGSAADPRGDPYARAQNPQQQQGHYTGQQQGYGGPPQQQGHYTGQQQGYGGPPPQQPEYGGQSDGAYGQPDVGHSTAGGVGGVRRKHF